MKSDRSPKLAADGALPPTPAFDPSLFAREAALRGSAPTHAIADTLGEVRASEYGRLVSRGARRAVWRFGATASLCLHAAATAMLICLTPPPATVEDLGAIPVEIVIGSPDAAPSAGAPTTRQPDQAQTPPPQENTPPQRAPEVAAPPPTDAMTSPEPTRALAPQEPPLEPAKPVEPPPQEIPPAPSQPPDVAAPPPSEAMTSPEPTRAVSSQEPPPDPAKPIEPPPQETPPAQSEGPDVAAPLPSDAMANAEPTNAPAAQEAPRAPTNPVEPSPRKAPAPRQPPEVATPPPSEAMTNAEPTKAPASQEPPPEPAKPTAATPQADQPAAVSRAPPTFATNGVRGGPPPPRFDAARPKPAVRRLTRLEAGDQRERSTPAEEARPGAAVVRGAAPAADIDAYKSAIVSRINATKRYPEEARSRGAHGVTVVTFSIDAAGRVGAASLQRSSGDPSLDSDALATVRRAAPYPPPPPGAPRLYTTALNYRQP